MSARRAETVWFDGPCLFLTCLEEGGHSHPVCPECGALRYGNLFCATCVSHLKGVSEMLRARKKPVEVQAIRWTGVEKEALEAFGAQIEPDGDGIMVFNVLEGCWIPVPLGHYLIKGVAGEFYPCDPEVFERTYEVVAELADPSPLDRDEVGPPPDDDGPEQAFDPSLGRPGPIY